MYSFSYLESVCCPMSSSNCCFLTCIQVSQEAGQVVWYSHLFQNFPQFIVIHTVKDRGKVKGRKWRGTKKPLDESESGEWKSWLKAQYLENEDHGIWSHNFMGNRWGNSGNCQILLWGAPKSPQMVTAAMKLKDAYSLEEKLWPT